jgi:hypothetical protein
VAVVAPVATGDPLAVRVAIAGAPAEGEVAAWVAGAVAVGATAATGVAAG